MVKLQTSLPRSELRKIRVVTFFSRKGAEAQSVAVSMAAKAQLGKL